MMNAIVSNRESKTWRSTVRRVLNISEITGIDDKTERTTFRKIYEWDPRSDSFIFIAKSADQRASSSEKSLN